MTKRYFPIFLAGGFSITALVLASLTGSDLAEQTRLAARWTARAGFPILFMAYSASSLFRLWPGEATRTIMRHRRQWGLGFVLTHTMHLAAVAASVQVSGVRPGLSAVLGGGSVYVLLYFMALTSNDASMKLLGKGWKWLHRIGIHAIWAVFTLAYFSSLFSANKLAHGAMLFPLALAGLGLRIAAWMKTRRLFFRPPHPA